MDPRRSMIPGAERRPARKSKPSKFAPGGSTAPLRSLKTVLDSSVAESSTSPSGRPPSPGAAYPCQKCPQIFALSRDWWAHFEKEHPDPNPSQDCPLDHFSESETDDLEIAIMLSLQENFKGPATQASIKESSEIFTEPVDTSAGASEEGIDFHPGDSNCSDEDTDWEEDEAVKYTSSPASIDSSDDGTKPAVLNTSQVEIVNRLMNDFWTISSKNLSSHIRTCGVTSSPESAASISNSTPSKARSSKATKHSRETSEDQSPDEDERGSKRKRTITLPKPDVLDDALKFACPYRKHNPRKYSVRDWENCALTSHRTVARVKAHLYRYHRIYQCPRCKILFASAEQLNNHSQDPDGCRVVQSEHVDGITNEMEMQLKSRKKAYPGQSDADRWKDIYRILFPGEESVPSPYFEPVIDQPDLPGFEEYLHEDLPRTFQHLLESAVLAGHEPIEQRLRDQIMLLFQEAQQISLSKYQSRLNYGDANSPPPPTPSTSYGPFPTLPLPLLSNFQPFEECNFGLVHPNESRDGSDSGYGASSLQLSIHSQAEGKDSAPVHTLTSQTQNLSGNIDLALEFQYQDAISRDINKVGPPPLNVQYWRIEEVANLGFNNQFAEYEGTQNIWGL